MRVSFGDCTFDSETRELLRGGTAVHLSPKAFHLLELLIESHPRALSKQELQEKLWPKTFVSEENLASLAAEARRAIGDAARGSRLLRTVYGFGYAFSGEIREERASAGQVPRSRFFLLRGEEKIPLVAGENILGRDPSAPVRIDDETVSRRHACIRISERAATIEDLESKNGTLVNGKKAGSSPRALHSEDEIQLGSVFLTFREGSTQKSTRTFRGARRRH